MRGRLVTQRRTVTELVRGKRGPKHLVARIVTDAWAVRCPAEPVPTSRAIYCHRDNEPPTCPACLAIDVTESGPDGDGAQRPATPGMAKVIDLAEERRRRSKGAA